MKYPAFFAAGALAAVWMAAAAAQSVDPTALSKLQPPERERRLAEGARSEGEVDVYTSLVPEDLAAGAAPFEKKYGVNAEDWRPGSEKVLERALTEARSSRPHAARLETDRPA